MHVASSGSGSQLWLPLVHSLISEKDLEKGFFKKAEGCPVNNNKTKNTMELEIDYIYFKILHSFRSKCDYFVLSNVIQRLEGVWFI